MEWLKDHWEMMLGFFAIGGVYQKHQYHDKRIEKLEEAIIIHIPEIKETLARIDERTKHL